MESTFFSFEMKEKCKVSCVKIIAWLIVFKEGTSTLSFYIFDCQTKKCSETNRRNRKIHWRWKFWTLVSSGYGILTLETGFLVDNDFSQDIWLHFIWRILLLTVRCLSFHVYASSESLFWNCMNITNFWIFNDSNGTWTLNFLVCKVKLHQPLNS